MDALFCLYFLAWLPYVLTQTFCQEVSVRMSNITSYIDYNDTTDYFTISHWSHLSYKGNPDVSIGTLYNCDEFGADCICEYRGGDPTGCTSLRRGYVSYRWGSQEQAIFTNEMPACRYNFVYEMVLSSTTPTPSESPSETASASETSSTSVSPSETASPSISGTHTKTGTGTATITATPSETPLTICQRASAYLYGTTTYADAYGISQYYILNHGSSIYHIFSPSDLLIGTLASCVVSGSDCICTYNQGSTISCGSRIGYITYRMGASASTTFIIQNPTCVYYFVSTIYIPPTPSRTPTVSRTPSSSPLFYTQLLTDSATDIGIGQQGEKGWTYMYFNKTGGIAPLSVYVPGLRSWEYPASNCLIRPTLMHTNDVIQCSTPGAGYCAPRAIWTNTANRTYESYIIKVSASHTAYNPPVQDGVLFTVRVNEEVSASYGSMPFAITNQIFQHPNISSVDITLTPGVGCNSDGTSYSIQIYGQLRYPSTSPSPSVSVSESPSQTVSQSQSQTTSQTPSASESPSQSPSGTKSSSASVSKTASSSPSRSGSSSLSGSVTLSRTRTPSRSQTRSVSGSRTSSASVTSSVSGKPSSSGTPLGFATAWSTRTPTAEKTSSETPLKMMTMWPSPMSLAITPTEQFMRIPYSRIPSPLSQGQYEQVQKENMTTIVMSGIVVGISIIAIIVYMIRVLNMQCQRAQIQDTQQRRLRNADTECDDDKDNDNDNDDYNNVNNDEKEDEYTVTPEISPLRENVTITPVDETKDIIAFGSGLAKIQRKDAKSRANIVTYYIPAIQAIFNETYFNRYAEIEYDISRNLAIKNDIHTRFIENNMYMAILSKSSLDVNEIVEFIINPIRSRANIVAIYNHENSTLYGDCGADDAIRLRTHPIRESSH